MTNAEAIAELRDFLVCRQYRPDDATRLEAAVAEGIEALEACRRAELAVFTPAEPPQEETEIMRAPATEAETVADPRDGDRG